MAIPLPPTPPSEWRRMLLTGADHIGDVLYLTASLPQLADGLPLCQLDFLCGSPADQILANNPHVRRVILRDAGDLWRRTVRESGYDAILSYDSGQYVGSRFLGLSARIPNRIGYVHKGFSAWVTHPLPIRYPQPFAAYFRDAVASLTGKDGSWPLRPRVYPSPADRLLAAETANRIGLDSRHPAIACFCSSRQPRGVAPPELYMAVLAALQRVTPGVRIVLVGTASDQPVLEQIRAEAVPDASILAGALPLLPLVEFMRHFNLVLTSDSGPRHLANAAGVAVAFFRNVYFCPVEAGSYGLLSEVDLTPCDVGALPVKDEQGFWEEQKREVDARIVPAILKVLHKEG